MSSSQLTKFRRPNKGVCLIKKNFMSLTQLMDLSNKIPMPNRKLIRCILLTLHFAKTLIFRF